VAAHLSGGVNKVVVTGGAGGVVVDRLTTTPGTGALAATDYQAEDAELAGSATVAELSLAEGGKAVTDVGGAPGNGNTLTFRVAAAQAGPHAVVLRYSNPEQSPASHYNPDPIARRADVSVNDGASTPVLFPHSFHANNFWEKTVVLDLDEGENTITLSSQEAPNFDGTTYASDVWPDFPLRSRWAPVVDRITVSPLAAPRRAEVTVRTTCSGPRALLVVSTRNVSDVPLDVRVDGVFGKRLVEDLAPGRTWSQTFPSRTSALAAGSVTVTAAGVASEHDYPAVTCG
jgi:hypothetical protein